MKEVKCITERTTVASKLVNGKKYWLDESSIFENDGDKFGEIYLDKEKKQFIGNMNINHFSN